jgi:hypothetical protein
MGHPGFFQGQKGGSNGSWRGKYDGGAGYAAVVVFLVKLSQGLLGEA